MNYKEENANTITERIKYVLNLGYEEDLSACVTIISDEVIEKVLTVLFSLSLFVL